MTAQIDKLSESKVSENFLRLLFNDIPEGFYLLIWTAKDKKSHWFESIPSQSEINKIAKGTDTYFGVGLTRESFGNFSRGMAVDRRGIAGFWVDLDYGEVHAKACDLPKTREECLDSIKDFPLQPSIIVESGNGFHAYWKFSEIWEFENEGERVKGSSFSRRWLATIRACYKQKGWTIDGVFDLARLMRLPGTKNYKDNDNPKECVVLEATEKEYNPDDFEEFFPAEEPYEKDYEIAASQYTFMLKSDPKIDLERFEYLCEIFPDLESLWNHKKNIKDKSPSGWDISITHILVKARWKDQDIVDLLILHRKKYSYDLKIDRADYYARTLAKVRRHYRTEEVASKIEELYDAQDPDNKPSEKEVDKRREHAKSLLSDILGVKVSCLKRFDFDEPVFELETDAGVVQIGKGSNIVAQTNFRYVIASSLGLVLPQYKSDQWRGIAQAMFDISENADIGIAKEHEELEEYIRKYLTEHRPSTNKDIAMSRGKPFVLGKKKDKQKVIGIIATTLCHWMKTSMYGNITPIKAGRLLKKIGAEQRRINFYKKETRTSAQVWILPEEKFRDLVPEGDE